MKIYESIDVAARPEDVWPFLADPQRMADWHAKLTEVRRSGVGPVHVGERFGTTYVMREKSGRPQEATTEVLCCQPWTTLVLRHHLPVGERAGYVDETYQLLPRGEGAGTRVEQTVDFAGAGMPVWIRAMMWCITRFGEPRGDGILAPLKRACETGKEKERLTQ